jgi:hypothetical protein
MLRSLADFKAAPNAEEKGFIASCEVKEIGGQKVTVFSSEKDHGIATLVLRYAMMMLLYDCFIWLFGCFVLFIVLRYAMMIVLFYLVFCLVSSFGFNVSVLFPFFLLLVSRARGATQSVLDDIERAVVDAVNVYKGMTRDGRFVPGGGATEIEIAKRVWMDGWMDGFGVFFYHFVLFPNF